jgi:hypothetical protein
MKGRSADAWQASVAAMPLEQMVSSLVSAEFSGIYVDREGYDDRARKLEADLRDLLGVQPLDSADGRLVFFDLSAYAAKKGSGMVSPLSNGQARQDGSRRAGQDAKERLQACQASRG